MKIRTYTGLTIDVLNPKESDINIDDISHALSNICRFGGHTKVFYSVAQHSVMVSERCPVELQLEGLLHDATEAYIGDIVRPIKQKIDIFNQIEDHIAIVIAKKFNLNYPFPQEIWIQDDIQLAKEWNSELVAGEEKLDDESCSFWRGAWSGAFSKLIFMNRFNSLKR